MEITRKSIVKAMEAGERAYTGEFNKFHAIRLDAGASISDLIEYAHAAQEIFSNKPKRIGAKLLAAASPGDMMATLEEAELAIAGLEEDTTKRLARAYLKGFKDQLGHENTEIRILLSPKDTTRGVV